MNIIFTGIGILIIGLFVFGFLNIIAGIVVKLVRRSRIKQGNPTHKITNILAIIAFILGSLCMTPALVIAVLVLLS